MEMTWLCLKVKDVNAYNDFPHKLLTPSDKEYYIYCQMIYWGLKITFYIGVNQ